MSISMAKKKRKIVLLSLVSSVINILQTREKGECWTYKNTSSFPGGFMAEKREKPASAIIKSKSIIVNVALFLSTMCSVHLLKK